MRSITRITLFPPLLLQLFASPVAAAPEPVITPFAAHLERRQSDGETCGYINAYILSALSCQPGSTCVANPTYNVAGGCCRLGDNANCILPTQCVPQVELSTCDASCSSNAQITRCSDSASPYCYTRYWVSGGSTPTEVGCTSTQGYFAYAYTTYTYAGNTVNFDVTTPTASPPSQTRVTNTASSSSAGAQAGGATQQSNSSDSGSSTPIGAIVGGVIGGVAVLGIIAALIVWIVLRHRRSTRAIQGSSKQDMQTQDKAEKPWQPQTPVSPLSPQSGQPDGPQEIATRRNRRELHQQQVVPELP